MKKIILNSLVILFIIAALASGTYAAFTWTWQQYDNPAYGTSRDWEYRQSFGNSQAIPAILLPKYVISDPAVESEMRSVLPAFSSKKLISPDNTPGSLLYTPRHEEYQAFIRDLANSPEGKERMRIKPLGEYPKGMPLTLAVFSKPAKLEPEELKALGKPIVWAHAAIHANEQDAVAGLSYLMYKLAAGHWDHYLDKVSVIILLRLNADGAYYNIRGNPTLPTKVSARNAQGIPTTAMDMNRDNMWLEAPVLRVMHSVWSSYHPHISAGLHQMGTSYSFGGNSAFLASRDIAGNVVRHPSGRVQLLVRRNADGSPVVTGASATSSGSLTNLASLDATAMLPGTIPTAQTLFYTHDIGYATGDHGNVPLNFRDNFYASLIPALEQHMVTRGVKLGYYLDAPTAPGILETPRGEPVYIPYAGTIVEHDPNGLTTRTVYDGTGVPPGATNGLWLDTGNMHSTFTLKGSYGILLESRAPSHQPWTYPRRVLAQCSAVEGLVKYAADNASELKQIVDNTRNAMANADKVYTLMKYNSEPFVAKGVEYYHQTTGAIVSRDVPMYSPKTVFARDGNPPRANPFAYILPKSEINAITAARIGFHGVKYYQLEADTQLSVEVFDNLKRGPLVYAQNNQMRGRDPGYSATNQSADLVPWIPGFLVQASEPTLRSITVPKGSFVFYTNQPLSAYLAAVLEPDAERSFARLTMARRLERDPTTFAADRKNWSIPYRYMTRQTLPAKEVISYYPLVEKAMIMDVRPKTGADLTSNFVMIQDMDVISDASGFIMQLPASASDLVFYAYNWSKKDYEKLDKATVNYDVANVYTVPPSCLGSAFEGYSFEIEPLAKAMNTKMVRIAAKTKPKLPIPEIEPGCSSMALLPLCMLILIPVYMRRRG